MEKSEPVVGASRGNCLLKGTVNLPVHNESPTPSLNGPEWWNLECSCDSTRRQANPVRSQITEPRPRLSAA